MISSIQRKIIKHGRAISRAYICVQHRVHDLYRSNAAFFNLGRKPGDWGHSVPQRAEASTPADERAEAAPRLGHGNGKLSGLRDQSHRKFATTQRNARRNTTIKKRRAVNSKQMTKVDDEQKICLGRKRKGMAAKLGREFRAVPKFQRCRLQTYIIDRRIRRTCRGRSHCKRLLKTCYGDESSTSRKRRAQLGTPLLHVSPRPTQQS
ncbi:unnamed protein product, partial [Trichogramma brassicae]